MAQPELLCIGDLIILDVEDGSGCVATHGLADSTVNIDANSVSWMESAFMMRPQQNYTSEVELNSVLETRGLSREQAAANPDHTLRMLFDACANEQRINTSEFDQKCGVEIRYGMVVQLEQCVSWSRSTYLWVVSIHRPLGPWVVPSPLPACLACLLTQRSVDRNRAPQTFARPTPMKTR